MEKCPAVVPCATADEESDSSLKLGSCVGQHYVLLGTRKTYFENHFFQMNPCIKFAFRKLNPSFILDLPCALYSVYTSSVGVVGLAEYVCTHPILYFYRRRPRLCTRRHRVGVLSCTLPCLWIRVTRRSYRMAQDSDDFLFIFNIVACVWIVILAIVALLCSLPRRVVR